MNRDVENYDQPEKKEARWLALCHAVESLTIYRESSPVVTLDHFRRGMNYVCDSLKKTNNTGYTCFPVPHEQVKEKSKAFEELHATRVGKKQAGELQVLFLCGPEPMNDLEVMLELGIRPENIWAVESDREVFKQAVESLFVSGYGIKIYRGSLQQFLEIVPQQFDIIYFDACGTLPSSKAHTLDVLRQLFEHQRLTPLSVLITNFSQANQDGKNLDLWAKRLGSWFFTRDGWEDFENDYWQHVADHLDDYYSNFISRFVIEFSGLLMPWWRVAALDGARREYFATAFSDQINLAPFHAERLKLEKSPVATLLQDSFPAYRRVLEMMQENLLNDDPLRKLFCDDTLKKAKLSDAVWLAYAFRNCGDPGFSATANLNKKLCSAEAVEALNSFRWVDQDLKIFCDEPCPHLLADLLLGLYGFPYHCNVSKQRRWHYVAAGKVTPMYLDVFVFDQARYFCDLVPTLPLLVDRLRFADQWILRVCMDGIFRHTAQVCGEWFYASTLAESGAGLPLESFPMQLLLYPPLRTIGEEGERIALEAAALVDIHWCRVMECRPEVTVRRDFDAPILIFRGRSICLWGCGALGSHVAYFLAKAGAARLILADNGVVTPGLLVRQMYEDAEIGQAKVEALRARLLKIRPDLVIESHAQNIMTGLASDKDWSYGADYVLDCTASQLLQAKLEAVGKIRRVPVISMMVGPHAQRGIMVLSLSSFTGGVKDVFRKAKIEACTDRSLKSFCEDFYPKGSALKFFQPEPGCSDATFVGSAADVSNLSGSLLNLAACELAKPEGDAAAFFVTQPHIAGANPKERIFARKSWGKDLVIDTTYEVRLTPGAWELMAEEIRASRRKRGKAIETGGILFGKRDDVLRIIWVDFASGPPPDSKHSRTEFLCGIKEVERANENWRTQTRGSVEYVGMWHTHPECKPSPSEKDWWGMTSILTVGNPPPRKCLLLIVGLQKKNPWLGAAVFERITVKNDFHMIEAQPVIIEIKNFIL